MQLGSVRIFDARIKIQHDAQWRASNYRSRPITNFWCAPQNFVAASPMWKPLIFSREAELNFRDTVAIILPEESYNWKRRTCFHLREAVCHLCFWAWCRILTTKLTLCEKNCRDMSQQSTQSSFTKDVCNNLKFCICIRKIWHWKFAWGNDAVHFMMLGFGGKTFDSRCLLWSVEFAAQS